MAAPENFSILTNRESVIAYIRKVLDYTEDKKYIIMDMGKIKNTDALTVSLVIAIMMDSSQQNLKSFVKYASVRIPPRNSEPGMIFRKSHFDDTVMTGNANQNYFMSRTDKIVNEKFTKEIIEFAYKKGIKDARTILNPILVEIFSNTNNHASKDNRKVPWFLSIVEDDERLCFSVIDLGIGIYESLKTSNALRHLPQPEFNVIRDMYDNDQSRYLASQIPNGVYSSTKKSFRGKGLKEIYEKANHSTTCKKFVIITNKAMVNLLDIASFCVDTSFSFNGTAFYWEMTK